MTFTGTKCYITYERPAAVKTPLLNEKHILSLVAEVRASKLVADAVRGEAGHAANEWGRWVHNLKQRFRFGPRAPSMM